MQLVFRFALNRAVIDTAISVVEFTHPPTPTSTPNSSLKAKRTYMFIRIQDCKILNDVRALLEACCIA